MRSLVAPTMAASLALALAAGSPALSARQQPPAVPQPFPTPGSPARAGQPTSAAASPQQPPPPATGTGTVPAAPGAPAATPPAQAEAPTEATLGLPVYPQAQFIASYDAGQGQRFYLFGTGASFTQVTTFYRGALKQRGDILFDAPQTMTFDVGRYREETMAFPPGVTVKDYSANNGGYLNPKRGVQPERFVTVIQIVPAPTGTPQE